MSIDCRWPVFSLIIQAIPSYLFLKNAVLVLQAISEKFFAERLDVRPENIAKEKNRIENKKMQNSVAILENICYIENVGC